MDALEVPYFQEYVGTPRLTQFTPVLKRSLPSLRRRAQPHLQLDRSELAEESPEMSDIQIAQSGEHTRMIELGKFYIVLGDSLEGYYLVKCLSTNGDIFSGKYFALSSETFSDKVMFRESQESDTFNKGTIVSEVSVFAEMLGKKPRLFAVNKRELDDVLLTISELGDI